MRISEDLERRIADIEARQELVVDVICALAEATPIRAGHFAVLALSCGFTAQELQALHELLGWAVQRDSSADIQGFREEAGLPRRQEAAAPLTREELLLEFSARLPRWKDSLETILRALRADGQFPSLCTLVLGDGDP